MRSSAARRARPGFTSAHRKEATYSSCKCATTASASSRNTSSASSWCSSACTTRANTRERASASPSARRWSSATAGRCGWNRSPEREAPSSSRFPRREPMVHENRPVEILLVEDNPGDERLTREALKEGKVYSNLHWVKDGVEAMQFLRREGKYADVPRPDIILLDLNLPKKDGREVLQDIKNDDKLKRIPVVVLTTSKAEEDVLRSYNLHANCYVTKPVDLEKFIVVVKTIDIFWPTFVTLPPSGKHA